MRRATRTALKGSLAALSFAALWLGPAAWGDDLNPGAARAINPCAAKTLNPCAAKTLNPCAAKTLNPCQAKSSQPTSHMNACNPCSKKMATNPCNPCSAKMAANPCGGDRVDPVRFKQPRGATLSGGKHSELAANGERLWNDPSLSSNGLACATCHVNGSSMMLDTFAQPFPHYVAMPNQRAGVSEVNAAEMVNFCMIVPMEAEPLEWDSPKLAALAAYVEKLQTNFRPGMGTGMAVNPCSGKANPCNPCGARGRNNPCDPSGMR